MTRAALLRKRRTPPRRHVGVWLGADADGYKTPETMLGVKLLEKRWGTRFSSVAWNSKWGEQAAGQWGLATKIVEFATLIDAAGYLPYVTWQPEGGLVGEVNPYDFSNWSNSGLTQVNATVTTYIDSVATALAAWGRPIVLRFAQEMNSQSPFPWRTIIKGGSNSNDGTEYVYGFRYVYSRFAAAGARNVRIFWCPDKEYTYDVPISSFYPGDAYCDIVGWDGYNTGNDQSAHTWKSPSNVHDATYAIIKGLAPTKPIWIGETSAGDTGGDAGEWAKELMWEWWPRHPDVESIQLFLMDMKTSAGQGNWDWRSTAYGTFPIGSGLNATASLAKESGMKQAMSRTVRRAGPTATPPSALSGCVGWYVAGVQNYQERAAQTTPATTAGHAVGSVLDQSGAGNHLTAGADDTTRAVLASVTSGGATFLAFDFDGSNDALRDESFAKGNTSAEFTVALAMVSDIATPAGSPLALASAGVDAGSAGANQLRLEWDTSAASDVTDSSPRLVANRNAYTPYSKTKGIAPQSWFVFAVRGKVENSRLQLLSWRDGLKIDEINTTNVTTLGSFAPTRIAIGSSLNNAAGINNFSNCKISQVAVFNRALADRELAGLHVYLRESVGLASY